MPVCLSSFKSLNNYSFEQMNLQMNESMNHEWMNQWINESMNEWIDEGNVAVEYYADF